MPFNLPLYLTLFPIYIIGLVIYRLFFHPLAKFPGPKLAAATKWYEWYFDIIKGVGGQFPTEIDRMHEIYGPVVRINPDEIHIKDSRSFETIYAKNPTHRDKWLPAARLLGVPLATQGTVPHELHRKRRLATSPFFSKRNIHSFSPLTRSQVEHISSNFLDAFNSKKPLDLRMVFLAFTTDTICRLALGKSMGLQEDRRAAEDWNRTIEAVADVTPLIKHFPFLLVLGKKAPLGLVEVLAPEMGRFLRMHWDMHNHAERFLEGLALKGEGGYEKEEGPRLLQILHDSPLPPEEKTLSRLSQEAFLVVIAGAETTARHLTVGLYHILTNPRVRARIRKELEEVWIERDEIPELSVLQKLPWLTAAIKEIFRITGLITSRLPLVAPTEVKVAGWMIPPKTPMSITIRKVLLDPEIFEDPDEFLPERWIEDHEKYNPEGEQYLVTFNKGTRMCSGMDIAYAEMYFVLAMMIRRFNLELFETKKERDIDVVRDCAIGKPSKETLGVRVKVVSLTRA